MKAVYPVVFTKEETGYTVYVPDFNINTQGDDMVEAIQMARDAISLTGIDMEDDGKPLPSPSPLESVHLNEGDIVSLVDVDFSECRRANENRTVRRNVSLPSWLDVRAEKAGLNVSAILQAALKKELHIND